MGRIGEWFGFTPIVETAAAVVQVPVGTAATSEGYLAELDPVAARAFGIPVDGDEAVTRERAMQVPAIRRGRALIAGTIGTLPLTCSRTDAAGNVIPVDSSTATARLLRQLDPRTTPSWTITQTVDDLLFRSVSWWRVTDRDGTTGYPIAVEWLHSSRVQVILPTAERMGRVMVDGREVPDRDLIRFDGPDDGLLAYGGPTIRLALALARSAKRTADNDVPHGVFTPREGANELSFTRGSADDGTGRSQVQKFLDDWHDSRQQRTDAYLNGAVEYDVLQFNAQQRQLSELAQHVDSQLARLLNLPASRIGAPQGSGMTYANTEADRRDLVDTTLAHYLTPIQQRLSMGDVTPNGQSVTFDLTGYLRGTVTELVSAGAAAIAAGLTDAPEVRTKWLGLPARSDLPAPTREDNPA